MTLYAERLLPHNTEAEEALIGSLLIDGECVARIAPTLPARGLLPGAEPALLRRRTGPFPPEPGHRPDHPCR